MVLLFPLSVAWSAAFPTGLFAGSGMVLQMASQRRGGGVDGALFRKGGAFRFSGKIKGDTVRASRVFARNDSRAPWRRYGGPLSVRVAPDGERIRLDLTAPDGPVTAVFRRGLPARSFNLLSDFGETFCDGKHLALLVVDPEVPARGGWLKKVLRREDPGLPTIGMFFESRLWYVFEGRGDLAKGLIARDPLAGDGVREALLAGSRIHAVREGSGLIYSRRQGAPAEKLVLSFSPERTACNRLVTSWTTKRRIPRGAVVKRGTEKKGVSQTGSTSKTDSGKNRRRSKAVPSRFVTKKPKAEVTGKKGVKKRAAIPKPAPGDEAEPDGPDAGFRTGAEPPVEAGPESLEMEGARLEEPVFAPDDEGAEDLIRDETSEFPAEEAPEAVDLEFEPVFYEPGPDEYDPDEPPESDLPPEYEQDLEPGPEPAGDY